MVEQRMRGKPIHYIFTKKLSNLKARADELARTISNSDQDASNDNDDDEEVEFCCCTFCCKWRCCTKEWLQNFVHETFERIIKRTIRSIVKTAIRYGSNALVTVITNVVLFVFGCV